MPKTEKKPKPFVRATGSHYDQEKWKTVVDKTKFERKLDDMAQRADPSSLRRGDLFYVMNYNSSSGWTDDDEDYIEQKWWEVLEVQKMNNDYEENRGDITRIFVYVYPVDECGNALTKTQIKKMYPGSADSYLKSIDNNGYATMIEWRLYDDEKWSDTPILRVPTSAIEDQDKDYKEIGRSIEYDETPREANYGRGNAKRFYKRDAEGYRVPKLEALKMWLDAHPGEKYDPEFDDFKKVKPAKRYNGEEYMADLTDDEAYENDLVKYAGTREERRIFAQYSKDEAAQIDLMRKAGTDKFEMYSCFGGFTSEFEKANEFMKTNHPEEYERACNSAKILGYGYHTEKSEFKDKRELKNFVLDNGGDWPAFRTAMSNMASQFAEASANAYYN